ncbi:MAG: GNAT family N-acetyltransferase [Mesosutterella sp.]|nr:GNAT family N-acetyltransferase [Mesosutterella sp.]
MLIRKASVKDAAIIADTESACFLPSEAASRQEFEERLRHYADHFWLLFENSVLVSFVDGMVTDTPDLEDRMYHDASLHNPNGAWQMIFGVATRPEYRRRGYAGTLIRRCIEEAKKEGRKGVVLTCRDFRVPYYAKFGFKDEGLSESTHGGFKWHQMRVTF